MSRNNYLILAWVCIILTMLLGIGSFPSKTMSMFGLLFSVIALLTPEKGKDD